MYEPLDQREIFERDNWTCKICGTHTPKLLRGTRYPNAPQLDHIIPLSKGGPHIPSNVQCACRLCNMLKGAKMPDDGALRPLVVNGNPTLQATSTNDIAPQFD